MDDATRDDGSLLRKFAAHGDENCFEAIVGRHGALVFGVCCRVLGQTQDAEDATQAVFLTLANKAKTLQDNPSVAAWLHGVAFNISLRAREAAARRRHREREAGESGMNVATSTFRRQFCFWSSRGTRPCPFPRRSPHPPRGPRRCTLRLFAAAGSDGLRLGRPGPETKGLSASARTGECERILTRAATPRSTELTEQKRHTPLRGVLFF